MYSGQLLRRHLAVEAGRQNPGLPGAGAYRGGGGQQRFYAAHDLPQGLCLVLHGGWRERMADGGQGFLLLLRQRKAHRLSGRDGDRRLLGPALPVLRCRLRYYIFTGGSVYSNNVCDANFAPRPAFNLKSQIVVSDAVDSDGCYTVESVPGSDGGLYVKNNGVWVKAA